MTNLPEDLKAETVQLVRDHDLDDFIEKHMGRPWRLQQNGEYGEPFSNDSFHRVYVYRDPGVTEIVEQWLKSPVPVFVGRTGYAEAFRDGVEGARDPSLEFCTWGNDPMRPEEETVAVSTEEILCELCNRGVLPECELLVSVSW